MTWCLVDWLTRTRGVAQLENMYLAGVSAELHLGTMLKRSKKVWARSSCKSSPVSTLVYVKKKYSSKIYTQRAGSCWVKFHQVTLMTIIKGAEKSYRSRREGKQKMKIMQITKQEHRKGKSRWDSLHIYPSKTPTIDWRHTVPTMHWAPLLNAAGFKR